MSTRVFAWDANPAVDPFAYKQSCSRADDIVVAGQGFFITLTDGRRAVQLFPPSDSERERHDHRNLVASMDDWITRQVSYLPNKESLRITTRQLATT